MFYINIHDRKGKGKEEESQKTKIGHCQMDDRWIEIDRSYVTVVELGQGVSIWSDWGGFVSAIRLDGIINVNHYSYFWSKNASAIPYLKMTAQILYFVPAWKLSKGSLELESKASLELQRYYHFWKFWRSIYSIQVKFLLYSFYAVLYTCTTIGLNILLSEHSKSIVKEE